MIRETHREKQTHRKTGETERQRQRERLGLSQAFETTKYLINTSKNKATAPPIRPRLLILLKTVQYFPKQGTKDLNI